MQSKLPDFFVIRGDDDDDEPPQFIVCMALSVPLIRPDNATGICNDCGKAVQLRPNNLGLGLRLICTDCMPARIEGGRA